MTNTETDRCATGPQRPSSRLRQLARSCVATIDAFGTPDLATTGPTGSADAMSEPLASSTEGEPLRGAHPLPPFARFAKRIVDLLAALVLLPPGLLVVLVAAIAIKLDSPGPVLFRQLRVGRNGRKFRMIKLRTMSVDNDDSHHATYVAQLIRGDAPPHRGGMFKITDDPRVTRVGRFLRAFSVDELPQVINVITGDMSLVGPRPALPREVALYDEWALQRLAVRPGLTGLWQVSGRSELDFRAMVDLDVRYWQQWSLATELRILMKTPAAVLSRKGTA